MAGLVLPFSYANALDLVVMLCQAGGDVPGHDVFGLSPEVSPDPFPDYGPQE